MQGGNVTDTRVIFTLLYFDFAVLLYSYLAILLYFYIRL